MHRRLVLFQENHRVGRLLVAFRNHFDGIEIERYLMVGAAHCRIGNAPPASSDGAMNVAEEKVPDVGIGNDDLGQSFAVGPKSQAV